MDRIWSSGFNLTEEKLEATVLLACQDKSALDDFDRVALHELARGYLYRWDEEDYELLEVEKVEVVSIVNPATGASSSKWKGKVKMDKVAVTKDNKYIIEHKSTSEDIRPGTQYWQRLLIDDQVSFYWDAEKPYGLIYDVVKKPTIRPLKATPEDKRQYTKRGDLYKNQREHDETPEEYRARLQTDILDDPEKYFQRVEIVRLEEEIISARRDTWFIAKQIRESLLDDAFPRNPGHCFRWFRPCAYFDVCAGLISIDDPYRFRTATQKHEEYEGEEK